LDESLQHRPLQIAIYFFPTPSHQANTQTSCA
jgi:hypothetical protein